MNGLLISGLVVWGLLLGVVGLFWSGLLTRFVSVEARCPSCQVPLVPLSPADNGYQVLACPTCTNTATVAPNARSHYATCPTCRKHSLATPSLRLIGQDGSPAVEVHEQCQVCGHKVIRRFPEGETRTTPRGLVIPFRLAGPEQGEPSVQPSEN